MPITGLLGKFIDASHGKQEIIMYCNGRYNGDMNRIQWELKSGRHPSLPGIKVGFIDPFAISYKELRRRRKKKRTKTRKHWKYS